MQNPDIVILGVFVADTTYRAERPPRMGETIIGNNFHLGPGGKGSNQSVAAAKAGARTHFITKLGRDAFADMALLLWQEAGIIPAVTQHEDNYTGAAYIFVEEKTRDNAIIICPGIAQSIDAELVEQHAGLIAASKIFLTQLEQPQEAAMRGLEIARKNKVTTILNPAPAATLPAGMLALCDYITPNETEAEALTGICVNTVEDAKKAAEDLCRQGAGAVIITLGEKGALLFDKTVCELIPAFHYGKIAETTGAGDAFNGGFAAALAKGLPAIDATRFGCAAASICVTRPGTAKAMPSFDEIKALLHQSSQ